MHGMVWGYVGRMWSGGVVFGAGFEVAGAMSGAVVGGWGDGRFG